MMLMSLVMMMTLPKIKILREDLRPAKSKRVRGMGKFISQLVKSLGCRSVDQVQEQTLKRKTSQDASP